MKFSTNWINETAVDEAEFQSIVLYTSYYCQLHHPQTMFYPSGLHIDWSIKRVNLKS